ncbi:MAG: transporter substrate-binding domain-containing protein [Sneathiella sp.]
MLSLLPLKSALTQERATLSYSVDYSSGYFPYVTPDRENPGIIVELIQKILRKANIDGQQFTFPYKRGSEFFRSGKVDMSWSNPDWFPGKRFPSGSIGTEYIIKVRDILIYRPEQEWQWRDALSILSKPVGTVRGYRYHDEQRIERIDVANEEKLVQMVSLDRIDVAIINEYAARYFVKKQNARITFGATHSMGSLKLRLQEKHKHLLPKLNAAIKSLREDGTIALIVQKYLYSLKDYAAVGAENKE